MQNRAIVSACLKRRSLGSREQQVAHRARGTAGMMLARVFGDVFRIAPVLPAWSRALMERELTSSLSGATRAPECAPRPLGERLCAADSAAANARKLRVACVRAAST